MVGHDTDTCDPKPKYRPLFLEHFDKKEPDHITIENSTERSMLMLSNDDNKANMNKNFDIMHRENERDVNQMEIHKNQANFGHINDGRAR